MRVATLNIQRGVPRGGGSVDAGMVAAATASLGADVLALQEVDRGVRRSGHLDLLAVVAAATGLDPIFGRTVWRWPGQYGNALLTRGRPDRVDRIPLPRRRGRERRGVILAQFAGVAVAATHLSVDGPANRLELGVVVRALGTSGPRILLGDLNLGRGSAEADLQPAGYSVAGGEPSFPAHAPRARIDHIAVAGGLVIGSVEVVATPISDHRAVVADIAAP